LPAFEDGPVRSKGSGGKLGADVNVRSTSQQTLLHHAVCVSAQLVAELHVF
jgi:hypothetical protein